MHNIPHSEESKKKMSISHTGIENIGRRRKTIIKDGVTLYRCGTCKEFKQYEDFYKNKRTILGITSDCKKCHCKNAIKSRDPENKRDKNREFAKMDRMRNPEKYRERENNRIREKDEKYFARRELNNAVKRGDVIKPINCQRCGDEGKLSGHHTDYAKPLDVEWLCYGCHGKEHRKIDAKKERCENAV